MNKEILESVKKHKCEEDIYGYCYTCKENMLRENETYGASSYTDTL